MPQTATVAQVVSEVGHAPRYRSTALAQAVHRSDLAPYLIPLASWHAAMAYTDGTLAHTPTIDEIRRHARTVWHRPIKKRAVQYQLRAIERRGFFVLKPGTGRGRGRRREYWLDVRALQLAGDHGTPAEVDIGAPDEVVLGGTDEVAIGATADVGKGATDDTGKGATAPPEKVQRRPLSIRSLSRSTKNGAQRAPWVSGARTTTTTRAVWPAWRLRERPERPPCPHAVPCGNLTNCANLQLIAAYHAAQGRAPRLEATP